MNIDLYSLEKTPFTFEYSIAPDEIDLKDEGAELKNAATVSGVLTKHIAETTVKGKINVEIALECTRCLMPTEKNFEIPFEAIFVIAENYTQAKDAELNLKDLEVSVFDGDKIDLTELVREQILLNLPEQIFCKEDCQGLCEKCGANRNLINCSCIEKEVDPRWSALKKLK